jgi:hypothetical protein
MKVNMTLEQKRALLDSFGGKYFYVEFEKKDHTIREATCKRFEHSAFTDGHASLAQANPASHKPELFTAVDQGKKDDKYPWININLNTLRKVKCGGVEYEFQ